MSTDGRLPVGTGVAGYRVEALIGRGGMGEVYRARDTRLDRPVALKVLAPALAEDEEFRERLVRESRLAASLDHPNVVPVYEAGEADGRLFIAMRYVDGTDLRALLRREGLLAPTRTVALGRQVADALDAAHRRGLVHRDVKPSNVLIDEADGREHCYLADFGLTQSRSDEDAADGRLMGTLEYVAPEQIRGDDVDGRADVYALACLLFEALTGSVPFQGRSDLALVFAHLEEPPPDAHDRRATIPHAAAAVLAQGMAKGRDDRPDTCRKLVADLEDALGPGVVQGRSRWLAPAAVAAAVVAVAAVATVALLAGGDTQAAAAPTGSLVRIDPGTNRVAQRTTLGPHPDNVVVADGRAWVSSPQESLLWQVNPADGTVRRIQATGVPEDLAALGPTVYVSTDGPSFELSALTPYDAVTGQRRSGIPATSCSVAAGPEFGIAASECPFLARIVDRDGRLAPLWTIPIPYARRRVTENSRVCQCDMSVVGRSVWVAGDPADHRVWRVDAEGDIRATVTVPFGISHIAADPDGVWVTGPLDDRVARIDPATAKVTDVVRTGEGPAGVAVGAGGVWIADAISGTVTRIDPASRRVVATIDVGGVPHELTVADGGVWVTVDGA